MGSEWTKTTLGKFSPFTYGKSLPARDRAESGDVSVYGSGGKSGKHDKAHVDEPGIIIGRKGTVGSVLFSENPFWPIDTTFYVTRKDGQDLKYTYYLLKTLRLNEMNADSAVPGLNRDEAHALSIKIPPYFEQKKIAHALGSLDNKIQLNRQTNQTLEAMAQALFKSWFVDFDPVIDNALAAGNPIPEPFLARAEARQALRDKIAAQACATTDSAHSTASAAHSNTAEPAASEQVHSAAPQNLNPYTPLPEDIRALFPSEFEETELSNSAADAGGWVPKGWGNIALGEKITPSKGKNITKKTIVEGDVPVVAGGLSPAYYHNLHNVVAPVITASASGANAGFINLYYDNIWASDCSFINKKHTPFVYTVYLLLKDRQKEITLMQQGAAQPHVYPKDLMRLQIADPTNNIWMVIEATITPYFEKIRNNNLSNKKLEALRDTLLPKLISGELRIPDAQAQLDEAVLG